MRYCAWVLGVLLLLMPCTLHADLSGTVTDTDGNPIAGALVTATNESDPEDSESVYTDESGFYQIKATTSGVNEESPLPFILSQNYPNPFNPTTTIPFSLDTAGHVTLTIYNIMGQRVRTLVDGYRAAGTYTVTWDGLDSYGAGVGAGLYLYRFKCGTCTETRKMLLIDGGNGLSAGTVPLKRPAGVDKSTVRGESIYKLTVTKDGYQPCFRHGVYIIVDADETIDFIMYSSAVHEIQGITFASIPGGTFQMGDKTGDLSSATRPVHTVTVSSFEMSKHEITNEQYAQYLNEAKADNAITATSETVTGASGPWNGQEYIDLSGYYSSYPDNDCKIVYSGNTFSVKAGYENWPVTWVTWYGAKAFTEHYNGLELPRDAEWEYACRWGKKQYKYGTDDGSIDISKANYWDTGIKHPVAVDSYPPNPYGLFNMSGNVWEWCNDWYDNYTSASATNPVGPDTGSYRVFRGGSWGDSEGFCRSASRSSHNPSLGYNYIGFRVVRRP